MKVDYYVISVNGNCEKIECFKSFVSECSRLDASNIDYECWARMHDMTRVDFIHNSI